MSELCFGSFVWPCGPRTLQVRRQRDIKELRLPRAGCVLQDFGPLRRVVSGEGEFSGAHFQEEFAPLLMMYRQGEAALLRLPGEKPFFARLQALDCSRGPFSDLLHYSFVFWEEGSGEPVQGLPSEPVHTVTEGETLWGIASVYGTTADTLLSANPHLRRPDRLVPGERVKIV